MSVTTDIERIKRLSEKNSDSNCEFRSFLKSIDLSSEKIDAVFRRHYDAVASQIDCCACANCCRDILPILSQADVARLAAALETTADDVARDYLEPAEEDDAFTFRSRPCPFLADNRCTVYDARPDDCRSYPHLHKPDRVFCLMLIVQNCSTCPIVFNVYERVKSELWPEADDPDLWQDEWDA
ncbi:YkgJ family cysteine cluster protein [bacterium]|nr:YkgJ family cysteine cluster protein [bacterium]